MTADEANKAVAENEVADNDEQSEWRRRTKHTKVINER